ncbi:transposase InsK for insertion sequence [Streptococcus pneumoniae]|nr:transposase InsK for insertion sequence [Streptococcus pneumoniae]
MNYTPKVRQKKSNFWGVFIMKLTYDDKVQIYELRKQGYSLEKLSNKFGINNSNIRYMIKLIDRYGIEFVKKGTSILTLQILLVIISLPNVEIVLQRKNFLVAMFLIKVRCLELVSIDKGKTTISILSFTFCLLQ